MCLCECSPLRGSQEEICGLVARGRPVHISLLSSTLAVTRRRRTITERTHRQQLTAMCSCVIWHRRHRHHTDSPAEQSGQQRQRQNNHYNGLFDRNGHEILLLFPCALYSDTEGHILPLHQSGVRKS